MKPAKYDIWHKRGTSFLGLNFQAFVPEENPEDGVKAATWNLTSAKMEVRKSPNGPVVLTFSTAASTLEYDSSSVTIKARAAADFLIDPAVYVYDLVVTHSSGVVEVLLEGNFEISNNVTK